MAGLLDFFSSGDQGSGLLGNLNSYAQNNQGALLGLGLGLMGGASPQDAYTQAANGYMAGQRQDFARRQLVQKESEEQQKRTAAQAIGQKMGLDPSIAQADPDTVLGLYKTVQAHKLVPKDLSFEEKQFNALTPEQQAQYRQRKFVDGGNELSLNPIYGKDAQGNTILMQVGKNGQAVQTRLPEGAQISTGVDKVDLGTRWGLVDKRSGQIVGYEAKDLAGAESQKVQGKAQGEAAANLPNTVAQAEAMLKTIQDIKTDPSREWGTGKSSFFASRMPGTSGYDFTKKVDQLKGQAFLQAFNSLRGGGQITEVEGAKAENAIARLDTSQTEEGFLQALNDLEEVVTAGISRAKQKAGVGGQTQPRIIQHSSGATIERLD